MPSENKRVIGVLSLLLLAAVVAIIVIAVLFAEKNNEARDLKDKVANYEAAEQQTTEESASDTVNVDWNSCDDISIIGAGIAGSYAGYRLRDQNKKITIYEYSDRIGGRCYTGKFTGIPDVNVEFGAKRFWPNQHKLLNQVISDLGLTSVYFDPQSGPFSDSRAYLRGMHVKYEDIAATDMPYYLPDEFKGKTLDEINWELFRDNTNVDPSVEGYLNDRFYLKSKDGVELWKQSRQDFYMKYVAADTAKYIQDVGVWDSNYHNTSSAFIIPTSPPPFAYDEFRTVASGFQSVPETMVDKFLNASEKHSFMRNHQLLSLKKNETNGKYVLTFQPTETTDGITNPVREGHYLPWKPRHTCASKVIIAVARLALESIDWEGFKQPDVEDYIKNAIFDTHSAKLFLAFDHPWWRNFSTGSSNPHYSFSDTPLRQTFQFDTSDATNMAVLAAGYTDSVLNVHFWRMINELGTRYPGTTDYNVAASTEVVRYAMQFLSEIYNVSITELNNPAYAAIGLWDRYPYGTGWNRWRPGYNWEEVATKMLRPSSTDDVFVACNAFSTTNRSSWSEGALEIVEKVLKYFMSS